MKTKIIDISVALKEQMPVWPDSSGLRLNRVLNMEKGDSANLTQIEIDVHTGTHLDSALHSFSKGASVDKIPLKKLIGHATVVYLPKIKIITAENLEKLNLPKNTARLLFRTSNSNFWQKGEKKFRKDYVGLSSDAASWLVEKGVKLVGIDYLSIASFEETIKVHQILLKNNVIILEGLNLAKVSPGIYQLICLPIKICGAEGAPARAVLIR